MPRPGHLDQRADRDPRGFHVDQDITDPLMLGGGGIGAGQEEHPLRVMGQRGPYFRAIDDEMAVLLDGAGLQRGEVRAGVGLRIALAPDFRAGEDILEMGAFLFVRSPMDERWADQPDAGTGEGHTAADQFELLLADDLLQRGPAATAIFARPGNPEPSACAELGVPAQRRFPTDVFLVAERADGGYRVLAIVRQPLAKFGPHRFVFPAVTEIHRSRGSVTRIRHPMIYVISGARQRFLTQLTGAT